MTTYFIALFLPVILWVQQDEFAVERKNMVENQLESRGIKNERVLNAMLKVPRHQFVPANFRHRAYEDNALPIDQNQTISQPYIVAYMTEIIDPNENDVVLEIGTGSGYQAAVLAEIVETVYTIEIIPELGRQAKQTLESLGYKNVELMIGDGYHGWKDHAPYDAIIVTAAPEEVPQPLINQLKEGGKMIIPVGPKYLTQQLLLLTKKNGKILEKETFPVRFVPFTRD